jgi:hypothetical protein
LQSKSFLPSGKKSPQLLFIDYGTPNLQCNFSLLSVLLTQKRNIAALYDACLLIVNTYNGSDMLDGYTIDNANGNVTAYDFMKYARNILNRIAEDTLQ